MIDSNWSGKQLSSEKATGKVVHSMAQQTARAVPKAAHSGHARATRRQGFCWGRELGPWEAAVPVRNSPSLAISTAHRALCASCTSLPSYCKGSSTPTVPHPPSLFMMPALPYSQGQSYETERRRMLEPDGLWPVSGRWVSESGCDFLSAQCAQRLGTYRRLISF